MSTQIEDYKRIIQNLFEASNMKAYILKLNNDTELNKNLLEFINKKNPNRDICRPLK